MIDPIIDLGADGGGGDPDSGRERTVGTGGDATEPWHDDSSDGFGDGSNRWLDGFRETIRNPVDRVTSPYDTVAGAADALALNFDEGVGGLSSLFDDNPGNTAGPGDDDWDLPFTGVGANDDDDRSVNDNPLDNILEGDGPLGIGPEQLLLLVVLVVALVLLRPVLSIVAGVVD